MVAVHRPDFANFRKASRRSSIIPRSMTMPSDAYLSSYINLEDLTQNQPKILFFNSRGRHFSDKLITQDIQNARLGLIWDCDMLVTGEAMHFINQGASRTYVAISDVKDNPRTTLLAASMITYDLSLGLLGLEIQTRIYRFLIDCAVLILHDTEPVRFLLDPVQTQPSIPASPRGKLHILEDETLEGPYRVPLLLNLDRLQAIVASRRCSAKAHFWMLQKDPGYFMQMVKDWKEHDRHALRHALTCSCQDAWVWAAMAGDVASIAYMQHDGQGRYAYPKV